MLYKRDPKDIYYRIAISLAMPLAFLIFSGADMLLFIPVFIVLIVLLFSEFSFKNLRAIHFKEEGVVFYYWESFQKKAMFYKTEALSFYNDPHASGTEYRPGRKLTLYYRGNRVFIPIGRTLDGWSNNEIAQIVKDLEQAGIRKEKYLQY